MAHVRTNENYLRWKLSGLATNVTMIANTDIVLESDEHPIAMIVLHGASSILVTDSRLIQNGSTLLRYGDVVHCNWIAGDIRNTKRTKVEDYDPLVFNMNNGTNVAIEGLEQAVFPLLSFFHNKLKNQQNI